jgi:hypothetical protein
VLAILAVLIEIHAALLRLAFESQNLIKAPSVAVPGTGKFFEFVSTTPRRSCCMSARSSCWFCPFSRSDIEGNDRESASWGDFARKLASRVILLIAAAIVPLLLWLAMMQLAYWGTEISQCPGIGSGLDCDAKISCAPAGRMPPVSCSGISRKRPIGAAHFSRSQ